MADENEYIDAHPHLKTLLGFGPTFSLPSPPPSNTSDPSLLSVEPPPTVPPPPPADPFAFDLTSPHLSAGTYWLGSPHPTQLSIIPPGCPSPVAKAATDGLALVIRQAEQERFDLYERVRTDYEEALRLREEREEQRRLMGGIYLPIGEGWETETGSGMPGESSSAQEEERQSIATAPTPTQETPWTSPSPIPIQKPTPGRLRALQSLLVAKPEPSASSSRANTARGLLRTLARKLAPEIAGTQPTTGSDDGDEIWDMLSEVGAARAEKRSLQHSRTLKKRREKGEQAKIKEAEKKRKGKEKEKEQEKEKEAAKIKKGKEREIDVIVECVCCLDDFPTSQTIRVPCHNYCQPCFTRLLETAIQSEVSWPPKCCLNPIPSSVYNLHAPMVLIPSLAKCAEEWGIPPAERIYCHAANCNTFIPAKDVNLGDNLAQCPVNRQHTTCTICRGPSHPKNEPCPRDEAHLELEKTATLRGWIRCHRCGSFVEHKEACQHMTCRCGGEFCYVCGTPWHRCSCTSIDFTTKKRVVADRVAIWEAEQAEIEEALRLVEEAEREEQRKQELIREEMERREREEREERERIEREEREERERIEREEQERLKWEAAAARREEYVAARLTEILRRREIREVFMMYYAALEALTTGQERELSLAMEQARESLKEEAQRTCSELEKSLDSTITAAQQASLASISKIENQLTTDLQERAVLAKQLATEYYDQLVTYHGTSDSGRAQTFAAMEAYHAKHAVGYQKWLVWRQEQLEAARYKAAEEMAVTNEGVFVKKRSVEAGFGERAEVLEKLVIAGTEWISRVRRARKTILDGLLRQEMEAVREARLDFEDEEIVEDEEIGVLEIDGGEVDVEISMPGSFLIDV